jgi:hypothetical protein
MNWMGGGQKRARGARDSCEERQRRFFERRRTAKADAAAAAPAPAPPQQRGPGRASLDVVHLSQTVHSANPQSNVLA